MWNSMDKCPECDSTNTGSSPTGAWCNDCGFADPGYMCDKCSRLSVNEHHLKLPERTLCHHYIDPRTLGPGERGVWKKDDGGYTERIWVIENEIIERRPSNEL